MRIVATLYRKIRKCANVSSFKNNGIYWSRKNNVAKKFEKFSHTYSSFFHFFACFCCILHLHVCLQIGIECTLRQLLEEGLFHADPHPGNLLATREGDLVYLDFGEGHFFFEDFHVSQTFVLSFSRLFSSCRDSFSSI